MKKLLSILLILTTLTACTTTPVETDGELTQEILQESLELGTQFLTNNQKEEGNFQYEYNFLTEEYTDDDNQVRQAGALWGLSLIHKYTPVKTTRDVVSDGLEYFESISTTNSSGRYVIYPGESDGKSGTVALLSLALIDFLNSSAYLSERETYEAQLDEYANFLLSLRRDDGLFYKSYDFETGLPSGDDISPYFNGEILLALTKYAKNFDHPELEDILTESAQAMYDDHVTAALEEDPDSDETKGFYQWGSMSFYELYTSDWTDDKYAEWAIDLAYWMIDVHETLERTRNTGYAYEGIIHAAALAQLSENKKAQVKFEPVIHEGVYKLTSWQVGHSIQNEYLQDNKTSDPLAVGGIMNKKDESTLRIDVAQHQMHVVILALIYFFE